MPFRTILYAVPFVLLIATGSARAGEAPDDNRGALLVTITNWLTINSDLPRASDHPRIELVPAADLHRLRYKALLPLRSQAIGGEHSTPLPQVQREVVAVYDDRSRTIYLPSGWTGESPAEQSILVHEMVHHLQNVAGLRYDCGGAREKPAYLAQRKWLENHGLDLEQEFEVDMMTIVALSACMF
jgi:hypothetical protein